jgi:fucose permease
MVLIIMTLLGYCAFISLGLPDGLLGVAWPSVRAEFHLPIDALGMLFIAMTVGYLISSFFSGRIMARLKAGGMLAASCALSGAVLLGFCAAPSWYVIVLLGVFLGFGAGAIDAGLNTYAALNFRKGQMQWLHAAYGIGVTLGPLIMTAGLKYFNSWKPGYIFTGIFQLILAVCFLLSIPVWNRNPGAAGQKVREGSNFNKDMLEDLRNIDVLKSLVMFFLYTGAEAMLGLWAYTVLTESRAVVPAIAGLWVGSYWGAFTAGRIIAGFFSKNLDVHVLVLSCLSAALCGSLLLWLNISVVLSLLGIALTGIAIAPVFPALVSATMSRVGERSAGNAVGMQMSAAALGAAIIPASAGVLARRFTPEAITVFLVVLFVVLIVLYSTFCRKSC